MKKAIAYSLVGAIMLSSCSTAESGASNGAFFGSILGSAIGGISGGHRGSDIGTIVGMAGGAIVGALLPKRNSRGNMRSTSVSAARSIVVNIRSVRKAEGMTMAVVSIPTTAVTTVLRWNRNLPLRHL